MSIAGSICIASIYRKVQNSFWFCLYLTEGANGDGMAVVSSLRSFDREQQKEFLIPIVIKDSGNPSMSGTSTLTVIIGDVNDNKMQPGSKEIFVYNYAVRVQITLHHTSIM